MSAEFDAHNRWLGGEQLEGVGFSLNDYVVVISGKHAGEFGTVVSVIKFEVNTPYIVETESGRDIEVRGSEISSVLCGKRAT